MKALLLGMLLGVSSVTASASQDEPAAPPPIEEKEVAPASPEAQPTLDKFREALGRPAVGPLLLLYFLISFAMANMESTYALLTEEIFGWGVRENGLVFGYFGIVIAFVQGVLIRPLARRFGEHLLVRTRDSRGICCCTRDLVSAERHILWLER